MPAIKKPSKFPGIAELPGPIRGLAELLYPQEPELPTPPLGTMVGSGPAKIGFKAAAEKFRPILKGLNEIIATPQKTIDPIEHFAGERLTDVFPGSPVQIEIPKFARGALEFPAGISTLTKRPAAHTEGYVQKRLYHAATEPKKVGLSSRILRTYEAPKARGIDELKTVGPDPRANPNRKPLSNPGMSGREWRGSKGKLTEDAVRDIRAKASAGKLMDDLLVDYPNVHRNTIQDIIDRLSWRWVKD